MKTLNVDKEVSRIIEEHRAFFAYGASQMKAARIMCIDYVRTDFGLLVPRVLADSALAKIAAAYKKASDFRLANNSLDDIIEYELANHESWYTGDIDDAMDALAEYNVTRQQVIAVYRARSHKHED